MLSTGSCISLVHFALMCGIQLDVLLWGFHPYMFSGLDIGFVSQPPH